MRIFSLALTALLLLTGCAQASSEEPVPPASASASAPASSEADSTSEAESEQESVEDQVEVDPAEVTPAPSESTSAAAPSSEPTETASSSPSVENSEEPTESATSEPEPEPTSEPDVVGYTLSDVAQRASRDECWVAISGSVYDLTEWIQRHPGGAGAILSLCGTDGTSQFQSQHGGASRPASELASYLIGPLVS